jgi:hypothetical protein
VGLREAIKSNQAIVVALALVMIVGSAVAIFFQARDDGSADSGRVYFSNDDGKSFFDDKSTKLPGFLRDGKPAYRAHVFVCGGKRVTGYLSRFTPEALKALEEANAYRGTGKPPPNVRQLATIGTTGTEVKRPGDAKWISQADAAAATRIRAFRCADGTTPTEVDP